MPDAQDIVLCSKLCRHNPTDPTLSLHSIENRSKAAGLKHRSHSTGHSLQVITGLPYGKPSLEMEGICLVLFFFSSVSVKVLPVTPLVNGIFVHRAFCAYFLRIERVVELRRSLWWTQ